MLTRDKNECKNSYNMRVIAYKVCCLFQFEFCFFLNSVPTFILILLCLSNLYSRSLVWSILVPVNWNVGRYKSLLFAASGLRTA